MKFFEKNIQLVDFDLQNQNPMYILVGEHWKTPIIRKIPDYWVFQSVIQKLNFYDLIIY